MNELVKRLELSYDIFEGSTRRYVAIAQKIKEFHFDEFEYKIIWTYSAKKTIWMN